MAQGIERREAVTDSLAGAAEVVPVVSNAAPLSAPQVQVHSQNYSDAAAQYGIKRSAEIAGSLNKWAGGKLQVLANTQREAAVLDGQMAYQQGKTMEAVEMEGDKWALSGYRVMNAQTLSQTMLATQRDMIQQSQYEQDPDAFRAQYISRMEAQIEGLDPQTARMVREQMSEQMPILVSEHTSAHLGYQEREAYKSLVTSVDALSKDASAFGALLDNAAGGPGSPSSGLSEDRRMSAVVDGVGAAFENMNPVAYQQLKQSGLMDSMSTAQKQTMRNAEQAYENRVRGTYDEDHTVALSNFQRRLEAGDLEPAEAAEALATIYGRRNITVTAAEGGAAYNGAVTAQDHGDRARVANIGTALARGDLDSVARQTQGIVEHFESGGDLNAVSPAGAEGSMQVMPATQDDPGFGVRPAQNNSPEELRRVGQDYWRALLGGSEEHANLDYVAGDIEAAAIAYNAGFVNANKWIAAGRDYSVLPKREETEPYAKGILAEASGEALHYSAAERLTMAEAELRSAQSLRTEILKADADAAVIEANIEYSDVMQALDVQLQDGTITSSDYRQQAEQARNSIGIVQTVAQANHINSEIMVAHNTAVAASTKAGDVARNDNLEAVQSTAAVLRDEWLRTINTPGVTVAQVDAASTKFLSDTVGLYAANGFNLKETGAGRLTREVLQAKRDAETAITEYKADGNVIARAVATGTVADLPAGLRARHDRELVASTEKTLANATAKGQLSNEQIPQMVSASLEASAIKSGTVTKDEQAVSTAAMINPVGSDGKPTPAAIESVLKFGRLYNESPKAAQSMFTTPEASNTMAAIFEAAQGDLSSPQLAGDAIAATHRDREFNFGLSAVRTPESQDRINASIEDDVDAWLKGQDIGILQGMFNIGGDTDISQAWKQTNVEQDLAGSNETREQLVGYVSVEARRLMKQDPALSANIAVSRAQALVLDRTAIVGGTAHVMEPGFDMKRQMFGELTTTYDRMGIEGEVITDYLAYLAESDPDMVWLGETSAWEAVPGAGLVLGGADAIAGLFGGEVDQRAMKPMDALAVANRGVRPYIIETDGKNGVVARILLPDGTYSERVEVPLATAGTMYMLRRNEELSD